MHGDEVSRVGRKFFIVAELVEDDGDMIPLLSHHVVVVVYPLH